MSAYGTIVEVKREGGDSTERAMLIREMDRQSFEAIVVLSPSGWGRHYLQGTSVVGLRGVEHSMWSVREEKP